MSRADASPGPAGSGSAGGAPRVGVAIPAAGLGRRMGGARKPWLELAGEPVLVHALRPFLADERVVAVRVAVAPDEVDAAPRWLTSLDDRIRVVAGGKTRSDSVAAAVRALPESVEVILVHDAARPLVSPESIDRCIRRAGEGVGAVVGIPATDTLKQVDDEVRIVATPERARVWHAQTPQGFPARLLRTALGDPEARARATDDASLVEAAGGTVVMVEGERENLKVTHPGDLPLAAFFLSRREATR